MVNPFDVEQDELISLASGEVLDKTAVDRLLCAEKLGEDQFSKFTERNLLCDAPDIFTKNNKKKVIKSYKGKEIMQFQKQQKLFCTALSHCKKSRS